MTDTEQLIEQLAARAAPVKPLDSPLRRTALWLMAIALVIAAVVAMYGGVRPGWWARTADPVEAVKWGASLLTGVLAAYAMFQISVPGRSPSWAWLPLPATLLWLAGLCAGCMADYHQTGLAAFVFETASSECARAITWMSLPLGLATLLAVRHAGVVRPAPTAMLAVLAAAAMSSAGVSLIHSGESSLMTLVWHAGVVAVLSALSAALGGTVFAWIGYAKRA